MQEESKLVFSTFEEASTYARHISCKYKIVKISRDVKTTNWAVSFSDPIEIDFERFLRKSENSSLRQPIENNKIQSSKTPDQKSQNTNASLKTEKTETKAPKSARNNRIKGSVKMTKKLSAKERRKISDDEKNRILQTAKNRSNSSLPRFERGGISDYEEGDPRPRWVYDKD